MRLLFRLWPLSALLPIGMVSLGLSDHSWSSLTSVCGSILVILGFFIMLHAIARHRWRRSLHQVTKAAIFPLVVGAMSLVSTLMQSFIGAVASGEYGAVIGITAGSIVSAYGDDIARLVATLSLLRLLALGLSLFIIGIVLVSLH